jgi:hypothetical protein
VATALASCSKGSRNLGSAASASGAPQSQRITRPTDSAQTAAPRSDATFMRPEMHAKLEGHRSRIARLLTEGAHESNDNRAGRAASWFLRFLIERTHPGIDAAFMTASPRLPQLQWFQRRGIDHAPT